jgi:hypothetical protein
MIRRLFLVASLAVAVRAETSAPEGTAVPVSAALPPANEVLTFARAQLPRHPVRLTGTLRERAPNEYVRNELFIEMELNWGGDPASALYRLRDSKSNSQHELEIHWLPDGPTFRYLENGAERAGFNPDTEIPGTGITWADLSFSFLWSREAETLRADKKLMRDCWVITIPRAAGGRLLLWIEQSSGHLLGAKEETATGQWIQEIKVVSVQDFDGLWMVKDMDLIRPNEKGRTTLRVDTLEAIGD